MITKNHGVLDDRVNFYIISNDRISGYDIRHCAFIANYNILKIAVLDNTIVADGYVGSNN